MSKEREPKIWIVKARWTMTNPPDGRVCCQHTTGEEWGFMVLEAPSENADYDARDVVIFSYTAPEADRAIAKRCIEGTLVHKVKCRIPMSRVIEEETIDTTIKTSWTRSRRHAYHLQLDKESCTVGTPQGPCPLLWLEEWDGSRYPCKAFGYTADSPEAMKPQRCDICKKLATKLVIELK